MIQNKTLFITGISTDVGKTFISAILTESLQADYWKPLQSGELDDLDSNFVKKNISNSKTKIHSEKYLFTQPLSPDIAAKIDNKEININTLTLPKINNHLIIEGAGGILVPLNKKHTIADLIKPEYHTILVVKHYLGSINHTLLSIKYLQSLGIKNIGVIFNGDEVKSSENSIKTFCPEVSFLGKIPKIKNINKESIKAESEKIIPQLSHFLS